MIFRRRSKRVDDVEEPTSVETEAPESEEPDESDETTAPAEATEEDGHEAGLPDLSHLDELEWRADGPFDSSEVDVEAEHDDGHPRIDLGSIVITGFPDAELRLQVAEETQQVISAMLISGDSALEVGAYAAPRTGGFWAELREELAESTTEAGGSVALVEGPFGVELRRLMPVTTPDGEQGYQPSRMWVVEGPRWLLRGIVYGEAALEEGVEGPVAQLLAAFREIVVRRDDQAMAPGDLLPIVLPADLAPAEDTDDEREA